MLGFWFGGNRGLFHLESKKSTMFYKKHLLHISQWNKELVQGQAEAERRAWSGMTI